MTDVCPYEELDPPVVNLCRVLNDAPGIHTNGSCGGGDGHMLPPERWAVGFDLERDDDGRPTLEALLSAEFIVWAINNDLVRSGLDVEVGVHSAPPYLNHPGKMLHFDITGHRDGPGGMEADRLAALLDEVATACYVAAEQLNNGAAS